jgi:hypothetical protein
MSWDVSGSGLGTFSDGFGMVLNTNIGRGRKNKKIKNDREYCSRFGALKIHIFRLSPALFENCLFAVFLYINSRSTALSGLYVTSFGTCAKLDEQHQTRTEDWGGGVAPQEVITHVCVACFRSLLQHFE